MTNIVFQCKSFFIGFLDLLTVVQYRRYCGYKRCYNNNTSIYRVQIIDLWFVYYIELKGSNNPYIVLQICPPLRSYGTLIFSSGRKPLLTLSHLKGFILNLSVKTHIFYSIITGLLSYHSILIIFNIPNLKRYLVVMTHSDTSFRNLSFCLPKRRGGPNLIYTNISLIP